MPREFELRKEVELPASPEQVWEAIATGPGLAAWFMPMEMPPAGADVAAWDPPRRLAIRTPQAEDGSTQAFEYLVEARDGGSTVLRFVHSGILGDDWGDEYESMTGSGWDMYLHTLAAYLRYFPGRAAVYVEAEAPPGSADPGAWTRLAPALGLDAPVAPGQRARLQVADLAPIDGVVDYVSPNFLGVRTAAALLRFHGRAAIGLPVAVSHHVYTSDVDADATAKGWRSWLEQVFAEPPAQEMP